LAAGAQVLVERVVARVNGAVILLSEVRAALALSVVRGTEAEAVERMVERRLLLAEVARFPPSEPSEGAVDAEYARLVAAVGVGLNTLMESTGLVALEVRDLARDSLRIQVYLDERFGLTVPLTGDQVFEYYRSHQEAFQRNGVVVSFEEAEPDVRRLVAQERRAASVAKWALDLRQRAEVSLPRAEP
jgi:hypothetical protein